METSSLLTPLQKHPEQGGLLSGVWALRDSSLTVSSVMTRSDLFGLSEAPVLADSCRNLGLHKTLMVFLFGPGSTPQEVLSSFNISAPDLRGLSATNMTVSDLNATASIMDA